jgi:hypothetical protein
MAQCVGPEFKSQYHKKNRIKTVTMRPVETVLRGADVIREKDGGAESNLNIL